MNVKIPSSEENYHNDPYLLIGYGVNAYFSIMLSLSKMFAMVALFALPMFIVFAGNT